MSLQKLTEDIQLLKECDLIRVEQQDETIILTMVYDSEEDLEHHEEEHEHEEEEGHCGCMDLLNGHLYRFFFKGAKGVSIQGEECDNYTLESSEIDDHHLKLSYYGNNLFDEDGRLEIEFSFDSYTVEDEGVIASPEV